MAGYILWRLLLLAVLIYYIFVFQKLIKQRLGKSASQRLSRTTQSKHPESPAAKPVKRREMNEKERLELKREVEFRERFSRDALLAKADELAPNGPFDSRFFGPTIWPKREEPPRTRTGQGASYLLINLEQIPDIGLPRTGWLQLLGNYLDNYQIEETTTSEGQDLAVKLGSSLLRYYPSGTEFEVYQSNVQMDESELNHDRDWNDSIGITWRKDRIPPQTEDYRFESQLTVQDYPLSEEYNQAVFDLSKKLSPSLPFDAWLLGNPMQFQEDIRGRYAQLKGYVNLLGYTPMSPTQEGVMVAMLPEDDLASLRLDRVVVHNSCT